jgi:5-formyltetrahydrofolate cyclo-ligase
MRRAMPPDLQAQKRALRAELLAARARLDAGARRAGAEALVDRLDALPAFRAAATVAAYAPLGSELDPGPATRAVLARGGRVVYPRAVPGERRLVFCPCRPEELVRGPLGAPEPPASAPEVALPEIACVLLPGLGFSRQGQRLGRGGGAYDATLAAAPQAVRVGVAFTLQLLDQLPCEPHDLTLDALVTERETLLFQRKVT